MGVTLLDVGDGSYLSVGGEGIVYAPEIVEGKFSLAWPNTVDEGVLSGAGWTTSHPLTNLQKQAYDIKARSLTLAPDPIIVTYDQWQLVGLITLPRHNLGEADRWRIRLYYDAARTDLSYDSGWLYVWPAVYEFGEIPFEMDNFWSLTFSERERALYTALATHSCDQNYLVRAIEIELDVGFNEAGFISLGRLFAAPVWQPAVNMSYGVQYGSEIATTMARALSGAPSFDRKKRERTIAVALDWLTVREGFQLQRALETQGLDREVFVADDLALSTTSFDRCFMGRFVSPSPLTHPLLSTYAAAVAVQEIV